MDPLFILQCMGMMAVAVAAVVYWRASRKTAWALFLWGALAWTAGLAVKFAVALKLNRVVAMTLREVLPSSFADPALWVYIGLLTGIFECGAVLVFACNVRKIRSASWGDAAGFGLGFGAIEAFLLGIIPLAGVLAASLLPHALPPPALEKFLSMKTSLPVLPVPVIERVAAVFIHTFSCLLIVYAVKFKAWKWFWVSFLYKTAVDGVAGYINVTYGAGILTVLSMYVTEAVFLAFAAAGAWGLWKFHKLWASQEPKTEPSPGEARVDTARRTGPKKALIAVLGVIAVLAFWFLVPQPGQDSKGLPGGQGGKGTVARQESPGTLTVRADRTDVRNSSTEDYFFICDRESELITCRLTRDIGHGGLQLVALDSSGNKLLSLRYGAGRAGEEKFSFGPLSGKFMPREQVRIRLSEEELSGSYALEFSQ